MRQVKLKNCKNSSKVERYIFGLVSDEEQVQAITLVDLFRSVTQCQPAMWGSSIVGFGEYTYYRSNGDEGRYLATGFSLRKSGPVIYIMPGYQDVDPLLAQLGKHKIGKSCIYIKHLDDIDLDVLKKLVHSGLDKLKTTHKVSLI
ncbi:MAG: DUF1801 domain-containing protein [Pseudomonadota bacterium]